MRFASNSEAGRCRCRFLCATPTTSGSTSSDVDFATRVRSEHYHFASRCDGDALRQLYCAVLRPNSCALYSTYHTIASYTAVAVSAPPAQPSVASFAALTYPTPPVAKTASALTQFNKLPPKPAAHAVPLKAPAVATYQPPPVMNAAPPAAPTVAAAPTAASVAIQSVSASGSQLSQAELLADEKCWLKLEQMRAKFESPLRTIYESLLKQGRDDVNLVPVQKMVRVGNGIGGAVS